MKMSILEEAAFFLVEVVVDVVEIWRVVMGWVVGELVVVPGKVLRLLPGLVLVLMPVLLPTPLESDDVGFPLVEGREEVLDPELEGVLEKETELEVGLLLIEKLGLFA